MMIFSETPAKPSKKAARRTRGPNPRGPRPQVCDRCYVRKIRCDKNLPNCTTCTKFGVVCSYNRTGFMEPVIYFPNSNASFNQSKSEEAPSQSKGLYNSKLIHFANIDLRNIGFKEKFFDNIVRSSLFSEVQRKAFISSDGQCIYMGRSMATFYYTSNSHLFSKEYIGEDNSSSIFKPLSLPAEKSLSGMSVPITSSLVHQLVELYFAYLNSMYPIVHPPSFFRLLKANGTSPDYLALLNAVCLSGTSYYPNRTVARIVAQKFSDKLMQHMKKVYLRPSLFAIQACTIASYHINLSESDRVIDGAWFFLGLAQRMSYQLGLHVDCLDLPLSIRRARLRAWWVLGCADTVLGYCFGRPIQLNATEFSSLPSFDQVLTTSISFVATDVILAKQMLQLTSVSTAEYFLSFCDFMRLMRRLAMIKGKQTPKRKVREQQRFSLMSILNHESKDGSSSDGCSPGREKDNSTIQAYREIEKEASFIYVRRLSSSPIFYIPENATLLQGHLLISYISILIDCNKPFIDASKKDGCKDDGILQLFAGPPQLTLKEYSNKHPLLKLAWVARLVVDLIQKFGENFLLPAPPFTWYVILQAIFALLVVLDRIGPDHPMVTKVASLVKDLDAHLARHSNRWALLKDMYAISSPLVNRYLVRFSNNVV